MNILITGGLGCIGMNISNLYLSRGHRVTIIDVADQMRHKLAEEYLIAGFNKDGFKLIKDKLENHKFECIEQYDLIIHMSANTNIPGSIVDPVVDFNSNILATQNLLEQLRLAKKKIPTVIFSSVKPYKVDSISYAVLDSRYEWTDCNVLNGIDEQFLLAPDEPYAATKASQSLMAQAYSISYDLPITILRFSNLYGAGFPKKGHGWLSSFCIQAAINGEIEVQGEGKQVRDMLHCTDIYYAVKAAHDNIDKTHKNIFNVGGSFVNSISVLEAALFLKELNPKLIINKGEGRKFEDPIFITNHQKFTKATGWEPKVSVKGGMEIIYNWALANKDKLKEIGY